MIYLKKKNIAKITILTLVFSIALSSIALNGCGDSDVAGVQNNKSIIESAGKMNEGKLDSTSIKLDLNLKFKSNNITDSKMLESNIGNIFNHIITIDRDLKANEVLDLQELQPFGIFGLYISSTGTFTLENSDGTSFRSKTILLEKCSFIDLKLRNNEAKSIQIKGFVAGE